MDPLQPRPIPLTHNMALPEQPKPDFRSKPRKQFTLEYRQMAVNEVRRLSQINPSKTEWQHTNEYAKKLGIHTGTLRNWVRGKNMTRESHSPKAQGPRKEGHKTVRHLFRIQYTDEFKELAIKTFTELPNGKARARWARKNKVSYNTVYHWCYKAGVHIKRGKDGMLAQGKLGAPVALNPHFDGTLKVGPASGVLAALTREHAVKTIEETLAAYKAGHFPNIDATFKFLIWRLRQ